MYNKIWQFSSQYNLQQLNFNQNFSPQEVIKQHGYGVGAFNQGKGEMVMWDGTMYRICFNQQVSKIKANDHDPESRLMFSTIFTGEAKHELNVDNINWNYDTLIKNIQNLISSSNSALIKTFGLKMKVNAKQISLRCFTGDAEASKDYQEFLSTQPVTNHNNINGYIVGIWPHPALASLTTTTPHLHFISEDFKIGGHIMDLKIKDIKSQVIPINDLSVQLNGSSNS